MKIGMWTVLLVAVVLLSGAAAQKVVFSFSNASPNEWDATYANCLLTGYNWHNVSVLTFWSINSASAYYEVRRNCNDGSYSTVNNTIGARFAIATTAPAILWRNVTIADNNVYSCSLRLCSTPSTVRYANAAPLRVIQPPSAPIWLSPNESVIQVYENELTRIDFACGAQLNVNESLSMCLNYVDVQGSVSSCVTSGNPGNNTVSRTVSTTFPRTAGASSYFNCYTTSLFNSIPVYTSGRTLQVNYVTTEISFSLKLLSTMKLNKLGPNMHELVISDRSSYTMAIECSANGIPEPAVSIPNVTDLSTSKYTVKGATFSCQNLDVYLEPRFTILCRALYSGSGRNKTVDGTLLVRAASGRTVYSIPALASLLALLFFKNQL